MNAGSLRFKLSLTNGLFISMLFVIFGYARYQTVAYRAQRNFEESLERQANFFMQRIRATSDGFEWINPDVPAADALTVETIRPYFVLTNLAGDVLRRESYGYIIRNMLEQDDLEEVLHSIDGFTDARTSDGREFRFVNRIMMSADGQQVVLHIARSLEQLTEVLDEYMLIYVWSVPVILFIAAVVGWFLAGHALKPFEEVGNTAAQITSEKLNTQIVSPRQEEEVQKLVHSFNAMMGRLRHSFEQMRRFNADVAHELRTPLAILQGENEIALRSQDVSEDIRAVLVSNLEELGRLTRIVNDILTLSEAEAGARILKKLPLDLKLLVEDLADQMQLLAMERSIRIELPELAEAQVEADDLWMRRAVLNLLDNAIKYSRDGGIITVSMQAENDKVHLQIRDQGIGIASDDLPHIFDRLFRTDPARNRSSGGTGLGLSLVKWVVESHNGMIDVSSEVDQGTEFVIELPLLLQPAPSTVEIRTA